MEKSVGSAIEKIKLQEQDNENKLKEKREFEVTLSSLTKAIRDTNSQSENYNQELNEISERIIKLRSQLEIQKIRKKALASQLEASTKELEELKNKSDKGISQVWQIRSSLCEIVQKVSDDCDVWALLTKPITTNILPVVDPKTEIEEPMHTSNIEGRLELTKDRKERAVAERNRLMSEPEIGPEFLRIKNALQYSLEMVSNLRKF